MGSNINSFEVFKQFSTVNTNISAGKQTTVSPADTSVCNFDKAANYKIKSFSPALEEDSCIEKPIAKKIEKKLKSKMLSDKPLTKLNVEFKKAAKLPEYSYRGLKGDPNANFYEYLSLAKIPYFIGGPMLAAVFAFGNTRFNPQASVTAGIRAKQIGVGVALYYIGAALARKVIDIPVKFFRGVDLNRPYENVVDCRAVSETGYSPKKIEYHKVTESVDFTRWDLMTGDESKNNGKAVNEQFDKLAKKFGIDKNVQDSDATLKGAIKKLIVCSTGFKYMLAAPFVTLGVALSAQTKKLNGEDHPIWGSIGIRTKNGLKANIKENFFIPMKESFKALWGKKGASNKIGRAIILTAAIAPILANLRILQLTSQKNKKFVDIKEYIPGLKKNSD